MRDRVIYIDESGDENLNIGRGASEFYVLAAVMVAGNHAEAFINKASELRCRYFQRGEIKSSKVGGNLERRLKILAYAQEHLPPFSVIAYRVRKSLIGSSSGLRFPKSFIKYFADDFCRYLPASGVSEVYFDEKGRREFKASFVSYLYARFKEDDLFPRRKFEVLDSATCLGIQVADLYAGSIAKLTDESDVASRERLYAVLSQVCCTWDWPKYLLWGAGGALAPDEKIDCLIRQEALQRAIRYIEAHQDGPEDLLLRCEFLKALIEHSMVAPGDYLRADIIEGKLNRVADRPLGAHALRSKIVGPLRDDGVLVSSKASGPGPGYKLPASMRDVESYIELTDAQVVPALRRVKSAAQIVRAATYGETNLLAQDRFKCIRSLTDLI